ncbi:hypothetical protein ACJMK2_037866 [Sinanodonta woodiana]|uniref:Uncharacterized protein n=1 Tax=Sinanodonta woodiana TaxID=1069815 RepID=A0ABD3WLT0_SINWO
MKYVEKTWITNPTWLPATWSRAGRAIRTTKDVEGWHNRLNRRAMKLKLSLYLVVTLLYKVANALPNDRPEKLKKKQGRILHLWDMLQNDEISVKVLLN